MKNASKEILKNTAKTLMFEFTEEECELLFKEFEIITKQMKLIGDIEGVDQAERMTFPFEVTNDFLREDEPTSPMPKEEVLKNAPDVLNGQIRLPKVVK